MSSRDRRLAETKYSNHKSATETAREREKGRSRVPDDAGGSVVDKLRSFDVSNPQRIEPDSASADRARQHKRDLPPIGGGN